jgi:hypothetical protein
MEKFSLPKGTPVAEGMSAIIGGSKDFNAAG